MDTTPSRMPYAELLLSGEIAIHGRTGTATMTDSDAALIIDQVAALIDDEEDDTEPAEDDDLGVDDD